MEQELAELSADDFLKCLHSGKFPDTAYTVNEKISLTPPQGSTEKILLTENLSWGEGVFLFPVEFERVIFEGWLNFEKSKFTHFFNKGCIYHQGISLSEAIFNRHFSLNDSVFESTLDFGHAVFKGSVSFFKSRFKQSVFFDASRIRGGVSIQSSEFLNHLYLNDAFFAKDFTFDNYFSEIKMKLNVGKNPAIGWKYEKSKLGVEYSLEQACEMCAHPSPLHGWSKKDNWVPKWALDDISNE